MDRLKLTEHPYKGRALVAAGVMLLAGCANPGAGRGNKITDCDNDATPLVATFVGQSEYLPETDPHVLAAYVEDNDGAGRNDALAVDENNKDVWYGEDPADKVGEIACRIPADDQGSVEQIVLTNAGYQAYLAYKGTQG